MTPPNEGRDWTWEIVTKTLVLARGNTRNLTVAAEQIRSAVTNLPPGMIPTVYDEIRVTLRPLSPAEPSDGS